MDSPLADIGVIGGINNFPGDQDAEGFRGPDYPAQARVFAAGRVGTPDEVGTVGALLMCPSSALITGSDFLMYNGTWRRIGSATSLRNDKRASKNLITFIVPASKQQSTIADNGVVDRSTPAYSLVFAAEREKR